MSESSQSKKARVRPPRVHIAYEVETGGAMQMKELPFVSGVMSDLAGHQKRETKLKDRKFVDIDRDNFDQVLKGIAPKLEFKVDNKLSGEGEMGVSLNFEKLDDFSPTQVARQVEPMAKLLELRQQLVDLKNRVDSNDRLGELLNEMLTNEDLRKKLKEKLDSGS
ncbi:MAG: type VI secretion system contractile sheath small subunit [Planctomycetes bacterium]|nr:type VI secretion system contractile sheath small subunit [Planctomycetota bacterium]MBZ0151969.1 type VI secretion system contractile sheath small subunit [Planctomycetota bacterium]MCC7398649.1 type VI secretion system contractile sheath small subunit [Planctomycetota bacterium]